MDTQGDEINTSVSETFGDQVVIHVPKTNEEELKLVFLFYYTFDFMTCHLPGFFLFATVSENINYLDPIDAISFFHQRLTADEDI